MFKLPYDIKQFFKLVMQSAVFPSIYRLHCHAPIDNRLVLFADAHHSALPFSMEMMHRELIRRGYRVECYFVDYKSSFSGSISSMMHFMRRYATARYVFLCDNYLPAASCRKRYGTDVIQLWHACGALKKFGFSSPDDISPSYRGNPYKNYTLITVSSSACIPFYMEAMGYGADVVKATGISRCDAYFNKEFIRMCRQEFEHTHPDSRGRRVLLWAPTFRGKAGNPVPPDDSAIQHLKTALGKSWYICSSLHPHMQTSPRSAEYLLPAADVLVTDYSAILFDWLLFDKPLVLYVPDCEEYMKTRGSYLDYETELPFPVTRTGQELIEVIQTLDIIYNYPNVKVFKEMYMSMCDGKSTERILKLMQVVNR